MWLLAIMLAYSQLCPARVPGAAVVYVMCCCLSGLLSADCDQNLGDDLVDEF